MMCSFSPKYRFYSLSKRMTKAMDMLKEDNKEGQPMSKHTWSVAIEVIEGLKKLGIPQPKLVLEDSELWWNWLPRICAFAKEKDLEAAKQDTAWEGYQKRRKWTPLE